jgi:hypothetical protein
MMIHAAATKMRSGPSIHATQTSIHATQKGARQSPRGPHFEKRRHDSVEHKYRSNNHD